MTISSTIRKAGPFIGDGAVTVFPFTFKVFAASDLVVVQALTSTGAETTKTLTADYTVTLNADQNASPGGTLNMLVAPPTGTTLTFTSAIPNLQSTDLSNQGGFYPKVINDALDKVTILVQQLAEKGSRTLQFALSGASTPVLPIPNLRAGSYLAFDASGNPVAASGTGNDAAFRTDMASTAGATLAGFIAPGGVGRTVADRFLDIVSVFDRATPTQIADVRACTAAVDVVGAANATTALLPAAGGAVFFPYGRYLFNSVLSIVASSVCLYGNGATIVNGQTAGSAVYFGDGVTRYYANAVSGLHFTSKAGTGTIGQAGITFKKQGQLKIDNVVADNVVAPLYRGIVFDDVSQYHVSGYEVQNCIETGVIYLNSVDGRISNGRSDGNGGQGHWVNGCQGHGFVNVSAYGNGASAWRLVSDNPVLSSNKNNWFIDCVGDTSASYNWFITDLKDSVLLACWGATQKSTLVNTFATGFYFGSAQVKDVQVIGGSAYNNNNHGVQIDSTGGGPENIRFSMFSFGSTGAAFNGNGKAGAGYGLAINGTADKIRVDGNCSFQNNTSGAYNNTSSGADIVFTGSPIGYKTQARGLSGVIADNGTIAHGLPTTPTWFSVQATVAGQIATANVADATNITVSIKTGAGATGTNQTIYWAAYL